MTFYDELVWRGLIKDVSSEDLKDKLNAGGMTQLGILYILDISHLS